MAVPSRKPPATPPTGSGSARQTDALTPSQTGSKLKAKLDRLSGVTSWRWHDLRRTARTGMTRLGVPKEHAEAAINHVSGRSTLERTYNRHDYAAEVAAALSRWQTHVAGLVARPASIEAVPLHHRERSGLQAAP